MTILKRKVVFISIIIVIIIIVCKSLNFQFFLIKGFLQKEQEQHQEQQRASNNYVIHNHAIHEYDNGHNEKLIDTTNQSIMIDDEDHNGSFSSNSINQSVLLSSNNNSIDSTNNDKLYMKGIVDLAPILNNTEETVTNYTQQKFKDKTLNLFQNKTISPTGNITSSIMGSNEDEPGSSNTTSTTTTIPFDIKDKEIDHNHNDRDSSKPKTISVLDLRISRHFFWSGGNSHICEDIKKKISTGSKMLLRLHVSCNQLENMTNSYGNTVIALYGIRIPALAYRTDFEFSCTEIDKNEKLNPRTNLYYWIQGQISEQDLFELETKNVFEPSLPSIQDCGRGMGNSPIKYTVEWIRRDLRRMSVALVGPRSNIIGSENYATATDVGEQGGYYPDTILDEVAIHFRCGDVVKGKIPPSSGYGIMKFRIYKRLISKDVKSIGIVTSSFDDKYLRREDKESGQMCYHVTTKLKQYLSDAFPQSVVMIRNDYSDSIPMVWTRLIMANQTFSGPSTFSIFPAIASFGTSYIQGGGPNYIANGIFDSGKYPNIQIINEDMLLSHQIKRLPMEKVIEFLTMD